MSFTFDRVLGADVTPFAGIHRFDFSPSASGCGCETTTTFEIASQPNGFARIDNTAPESDAAGREVGVFAGGHCMVSPTGRVWCQLAYGPTFVSAWFPAAELFGRIAREGETTGTGRAEAFRHDDRETPRRAAWTATRLAPLPEPTATTSP